jgi:histone H3/H4
MAHLKVRFLAAQCCKMQFSGPTFKDFVKLKLKQVSLEKSSTSVLEIEEKASDALQLALELYIGRLLKDVTKVARYSNRTTATITDLKLVLSMRGQWLETE